MHPQVDIASAEVAPDLAVIFYIHTEVRQLNRNYLLFSGHMPPPPKHTSISIVSFIYVFQANDIYLKILE